jgi:hypothetical protein
MTVEESTDVVRVLPSGDTLVFRDGPRRAYHLQPADGGKAKKLVSVTTALGILAKPALIRWAEERGAAGALAAVRLGELRPDVHADEEAVGVVRALDLGADAAKRKASTRGLSIHDALEAWSTDGDLPNPADMDPEHRPYLQGLMRWLVKADPEPEAVEEVTCHPQLGYAGRLDLIARIGGRRVLCDLKTAKGGRGYPEAHVQARAYEMAEVALGGEQVDDCLIVAVGPDGQFCEDWCTAPHDAFERVLDVYRLMADVRRPIDAAARAAKKAAAS